MINPEDMEKENKGQEPGARLLAVRKLLNFSTLGDMAQWIKYYLVYASMKKRISDPHHSCTIHTKLYMDMSNCNLALENEDR